MLFVIYLFVALFIFIIIFCYYSCLKWPLYDTTSTTTTTTLRSDCSQYAILALSELLCKLLQPSSEKGLFHSSQLLQVTIPSEVLTRLVVLWGDVLSVLQFVLEWVSVDIGKVPCTGYIGQCVSLVIVFGVGRGSSGSSTSGGSTSSGDVAWGLAQLVLLHVRNLIYHAHSKLCFIFYIIYYIVYIIICCYTALYSVYTLWYVLLLHSNIYIIIL